jgi:hypothetical protein
VILTIDIVTPKSIGVFYPILTIILWSLNTVGQMELNLCIRNNNFQCKDQCDPDVWPYDPKINKGHVLVLAVHPIKFWSCRLINTSYWAETVFSFNVIVTLTFDFVTPKSIGVFHRIWIIILWSLKIVGQMELKLCSGNWFQF